MVWSCFLYKKVFFTKDWCTETNELPSCEDFARDLFEDNNSKCYLLHLNLGNCATDILSNLDFVHLRAVIIIFNLYLSLSDVKCLSKCNWPSISYFYKKSVLIFKHKVYFDSLFETKLFVGFVPTLIAYLVAQTSCLKRLPKCNLSIFSCPPPPIKAILFHSPL